MVGQKPESHNIPLMYGGLLPQEEMLEIGKRQKKLIIGMPREKQHLEQRISLTPEAIEVLIDNGHEVLIESKAGEGAHYSDKNYSECGGFIVENKSQVLGADIVLKVEPIDLEEIDLLKGNQVIFSGLHIHTQKEDYIRKLMDKKITAIAYEYIKDEYNYYPILQSINAIAGNTAIIIAAEYLSVNNGGERGRVGGIFGINRT